MAYHLISIDESERFDISVFGMQELRSAMASVDILEQPDFYNLDLLQDHGYTAVIAKHHNDAATLSLDHRAVDLARVPANKFTEYAQYGWHVLPEECSIIAAGLRNRLTVDVLQKHYDKVRAWFQHFGYTGVALDARVQQPDSLQELVDLAKEFSEFCELASERGGFHVY